MADDSGTDLLEDEKVSLAKLELFPDVQNEFLRQKIEVGWNEDRVINFILSNRHNVPLIDRRMKVPEKTEPVKEVGFAEQPSNEQLTNEERRQRLMRVFRQPQFRNLNEVANLDEHFAVVVDLLSKKFPRVHRKCIRFVVGHCRSNYAPSYAVLGFAKASNEWPSEGRIGMRRVNHTFGGWKCVYELVVNGNPRPTPKSPRKGLPIVPSMVQEQVDLIEQLLNEAVPEEVLAEVDGDWEGPMFECIICSGSQPMTTALVCSADEDHRFCLDCVRGHAAACADNVGQTVTGLSCMQNKCTSSIAWETVRGRIEPRLRNRLDERFASENIALASIENLERCKYCNYAAVHDEPITKNKVFHCDMCHVERCRLCNRDWDETHFGLPCEDAAKADSAHARHEYENMLAEVTIRRCPVCRVPFQKETGCNKMLCRCGLTQCYLCRASNIGYDHFCEHPRPLGQACQLCDKPCSISFDARAMDARKIEELERRISEDARVAGELRTNGAIGGNEPFRSSIMRH